MATGVQPREARIVTEGTLEDPTSQAGSILEQAIERVALLRRQSISEGSMDIVGSPSAQIGDESDAITVFGGSTSFPHVLAPGTSLAFFGGGYDNQNRKYPGAPLAPILTVMLGAHNVADAPDGHGSIGGGSYQAVHGNYGTAAGGIQNSVHGHYGASGGGRQNSAGAHTKTLVAGVPPGAGTNAVTLGAVSGRAVADGMTMIIDVGVRVEIFLNVTIVGSVVTLPTGSTFARPHALNAPIYFTDGTITDAFVGGGQANDAMGLQSFVGGGFNNKARGPASTVPGGSSNIAGTYTAPDATVGGGSSNVASGAGATISGGVSNVSNGINAFVGGGTLNTASGLAASVLGGRDNQALASYSSARGQAAVATLYGEHVFASGNFGVVGDAAGSDLMARCVMTGVGTAEMFLNQVDQRLTLADRSMYDYDIRVVAYARDISTNRANEILGRWRIVGGVYRKVGAATTAMFSKGVTADTNNVAGFGADVVADTTTGALRIDATSVAAHSVFFVARISLVKVVS